MISEEHFQSGRANGARSRSAKTPDGRRNSSIRRLVESPRRACDASSKANPLDASQNLKLTPQLTEKVALRTRQNNSHLPVHLRHNCSEANPVRVSGNGIWACFVPRRSALPSTRPTRTSGGGPGPSTGSPACDASPKIGPLDASQNLDAPPQPTETDKLNARRNNSHLPVQMRRNHPEVPSGPRPEPVLTAGPESSRMKISTPSPGRTAGPLACMI